MLELILEKLAKLIASHLKQEFIAFAIATLTVHPGDTIVVKSRYALSDDAWAHLTKAIKNQFQDNNIIALEDDLDLAIIRANKN